MPFRLPIYLAAFAATVTACTTATATPTTTSTMPTTTISSTTTSLAPTTTTTTTVVVRAEEVRPASPPPSREAPAVTATSAACGGNLPPCHVCQRESHCTYGIVSNGGCSGWNCYGKWQFDPTTWRAVVQRYGLTDIPAWPPTDWARVTPAMEDRVAAALWAEGAGCGHWAAC